MKDKFRGLEAVELEDMRVAGVQAGKVCPPKVSRPVNRARRNYASKTDWGKARAFFVSRTQSEQ